MSKFITIDIGSSFVKAALFDLCSHTLIAKDKRPSPQKTLKSDPNCFEVPAECYMDLVQDLLDKLTTGISDITGLLFSTQMHGIVFKPENAEPVYISWQDQRCIEKNGEFSYLEELKKKIAPEDMLHHGVYLKPMMGLCNLYTAIQQKQFSPKGELFSLGSFITSRLCGKNICHPHNAAPIGLIKVDTRDIDEKLIETLGLEKIKLPQIAKSDNEVIGEISLNGNKIKIYPDFGDMQIAALGSRIDKGCALINIATASQVMYVTDSLKPGVFETRPFFGGLYLRTISQLPSGRTLKVVIDFLKQSIQSLCGTKLSDDDIWTKVHSLLKEEHKNESKSLIIDPYFYASGNHLDGGNISGITADNLNIGQIFKAMFVAMAHSYREHLEQLGNYERISKIVCAGGVSFKVPELIEKIRLATKKDCQLPIMQDEAIFGMFIAAMYCSGNISSVYDNNDLTLTIKE